MSGGDIVISKDEEFPTTRDNTIFELGLFMGFLGRQCTLSYAIEISGTVLSSITTPV